MSSSRALLMQAVATTCNRPSWRAWRNLLEQKNPKKRREKDLVYLNFFSNYPLRSNSDPEMFSCLLLNLKTSPSGLKFFMGVGVLAALSPPGQTCQTCQTLVSRFPGESSLQNTDVIHGERSFLSLVWSQQMR
ncbi:hypothetical protein FQA47_015647 [Oryzias melastigma]|uniref:Uncharacterized protein n=1 Tax=Oryzias melastigma TaxID=30732 RepID=A0A834F9L1_ORYME|nr:hypothetical protein FQA47_015647 [Oryzias melastigma]